MGEEFKKAKAKKGSQAIIHLHTLKRSHLFQLSVNLHLFLLQRG